MGLKDVLRAARSAVRSAPTPCRGPFAIGRRDLDVELPDGTRLHLDVFHPAPAGAVGTPVPLFSDPLRHAMHAHMGIPLAALPRREMTEGQTGLPMAPGRHPVVTFMHGLGSFALQNRRLLEALASHGIVSLAPSGPGDSLTTEYSDGTLAPFDADEPAIARQKGWSKEEAARFFREVAERSAAVARADGPTATREAIDRVVELPTFGLYRVPAQRMADRLVALLGVLDRLDHPLVEHLDRDRIGLVGHSIGGAVSLRASQERAAAGRPVRAVVNLDGLGFLHAGHLDAGAPVAVFHGHATRYQGHALSNARVNAGWVHYGSGGWILECATAAHAAFTDLAFAMPAQATGALGDVDGPRFGTWTHEAIHAFLATHLQDRPTRCPPHPDVTVEVVDGDDQR